MQQSLKKAIVDSLEVHAAWIDTSEQFERLGAEWRALFDRVGLENAFLSFEWMYTWWKYWGKDPGLAIIAVRELEGRLVAVAPFYIRSRFHGGIGPRCLGFLADSHVGSDHLNIFAEREFEAAALEQIVQTLLQHRSQWGYIELRDAEDTPLLINLAGRLQEAGMSRYETGASVCYHLPLPATFEACLANASANLRSNFRRRSGALQRQGTTECVVLTNSKDLEDSFPDLVRLHRIRFESARRESAFLPARVQEFHADVLKALASRGWARLLLLRVDGENVAALYGFSVGSTFQFYQSGMHTGWLSKGVGLVTMGHAIAYAVRAGHRNFDFLRGAERYKAQWGPGVRHTITMRFFERRPSGQFARLLQLGHIAARRVEDLVKRVLIAPR